MPGLQDEVVIGPGSGTVSVSADTAVARLTLSGRTVSGSGKLTVNGPLDWRGGTIRGTVQCQGGSVGTSSTTLQGQLINTGTLTVSTPLGYAFYTGNGSVISNLAGATLAWNTDVGTTHSGGVRGTIQNEGRFQKSAAAGTTVITDHLQSSGVVQVESGTLSLATTSVLGGRCEANGTAILDFPSGKHTLAGCTLGGSGMIRFSGATIDIDGPTSGEAGVVVRLTAGEVTDDCPVDCHLTLAGALDWRGGTIKGKIQCAGGTVGVGSTTLSRGLLINTGTLVVSTPLGYAFYTGNGSVISNLAGATLLWNTDVGTTYQGGTAGTIYNQGRFTKSLGAGTALINDTFQNQSSGSVEVESGVLSLRNGGSNSGQNLATGPARLDFGGGTHTLDGSARLTGDGTFGCSAGTVDFSGNSASSAHCLINGGTFNCQSATTVPFAVLTVSSGTLGGTGPVRAGSLDWRGGTIRGTVQCQGGSVGVSSVSLTGGRLVNTGTLTVSTPLGYAFYTGAGSAIDNSPGATLAWHTDVGTTHLGGDRGTIHNAGRFQKDLSAGTTIINDTFNNVGTVEARSGTLSLTQPYLQTAGATRLLGGRLLVSAGMTLNGGVLAGTSTVVGKVVSRGTVGPGASPGLLTIHGDYTQLAEGVLEIELGGTTVGTGYDRLAVTGATALAGTLRIVVVDGFEPPPDTVFEFLTMTTREGDFQTIECPTCPAGSMTSLSDTGAALITGPAEDAPLLTINRAAPDVVVLSWPRQAEGWVLEHTDEMPGAPGPWPPVQQAYQTNDTAIAVSYPFMPGSGTVFFRLRKGPAGIGPAAP